MGTSLNWKIVVGQRRFTSGHRVVGGEEEEPRDGLHKKQTHGRRYTSLAFGNVQTALSCIDNITRIKNDPLVFLFTGGNSACC
jgi:hypothetical protein